MFGWSSVEKTSFSSPTLQTPLCMCLTAFYSTTMFSPICCTHFGTELVVIFCLLQLFFSSITSATCISSADWESFRHYPPPIFLPKIFFLVFHFLLNQFIYLSLNIELLMDLLKLFLGLTLLLAKVLHFQHHLVPPLSPPSPSVPLQPVFCWPPRFRPRPPALPKGPWSWQAVPQTVPQSWGAKTWRRILPPQTQQLESKSESHEYSGFGIGAPNLLPPFLWKVLESGALSQDRFPISLFL